MVRERVCPAFSMGPVPRTRGCANAGSGKRNDRKTEPLAHEARDGPFERGRKGVGRHGGAEGGQFLPGLPAQAVDEVLVTAPFINAISSVSSAASRSTVARRSSPRTPALLPRAA